MHLHIARDGFAGRMGAGVPATRAGACVVHSPVAAPHAEGCVADGDARPPLGQALRGRAKARAGLKHTALRVGQVWSVYACRRHVGKTRLQAIRRAGTSEEGLTAHTALHASVC